MIFLLNFLPHYCPNCMATVLMKDRLAKEDFFAGASHSCSVCKAKFVYINTDKLLECAKDTDLPEYYERKLK